MRKVKKTITVYYFKITILKISEKYFHDGEVKKKMIK